MSKGFVMEMRIFERMRNAIAFLILAVVAISTVSTAALADRATLRVDTRAPGVPVSPLLYGAFFEEINHAGDGGLYAELVRNRSFEDASAPDGWTTVARGARADIALDESRPLNAGNRRALRLEIASDGAGNGAGRAGIANEGYWGMAVRAGELYDLSLHARRDDRFSGALDVSLESADGRVLAQSRITGLSPEWKRHAVSLRATASDPKARLVITSSSPGTVGLDVVSLFPRRTWKGRANGLRFDLAEKIATMKPAFIRFPGGCFVEGNFLQNAFRWKTTIGDITLRPGHLNDNWGYRSTDGLGFHEYLQMCEDMNAEPLFVINCGMAHRDIVPLNELDPWVQDALDAVEYANGPITSKWGALRARNGHPAPFGLKLIQVGNENGGPAYDERYARFYDALKSRYPGIRLIANLWGGTPKSRPIDILDEHYYNSPQFFVANARRYDTYDRKGPKIYVGEYAVTQGAGTGNLAAALGEAAFMTGMERNADIVVMSSYAPLLVNVNDRRWNPDAIVFDSATSYGTPSYYVQRLFAHHRADRSLPMQITTESKTPRATGGIGLSTWRTQAEFDDVKVTARDGQTLLAEDFAAGAGGWRILGGDWKAQNGVFAQTGNSADGRAVAGDPNWSDYTLSLRARKLGGDEGFLIMFRTRDEANYSWWNLGGWGNVRHAVEKSSGGSKSIISREVPGRIETGRWSDIRIELQGTRIRCYLDGKLIHDFEDRTPAPLNGVAGRDHRSGELVLKVVNSGATAQDAQIDLAGAQAVAPDATAITLTADSPAAENSLEQPHRVVPVQSRARIAGPNFRYVFPPHSLTILRLRAR